MWLGVILATIFWVSFYYFSFAHAFSSMKQCKSSKRPKGRKNKYKKKRKQKQQGKSSKALRNKVYKGLPIAHRSILYDTRTDALKDARFYTKLLYGVHYEPQKHLPLEHLPHHKGQHPHFHVYKHKFFVEKRKKQAVNYHFEWHQDYSIVDSDVELDDLYNDYESDTETDVPSGTETEGESGFEDDSGSDDESEDD